MILEIAGGVTCAFCGWAGVTYGTHRYLNRKDRDGDRIVPTGAPRGADRGREAEHMLRLAERVAGGAVAGARAGEGADAGLSGEAPDLIEPILAWRGWDVDRNGRLHALHSHNAYFAGIRGSGPVWEPRKAPAAVCSMIDLRTQQILRTSTAAGRMAEMYAELELERKRHHAPYEGCSCGYYAAKGVRNIQHSYSGTAFGLVALWGRVIEYDDGYRAQFAYPVNVAIIPDSDWPRGHAEHVLYNVQTLYGIPVRFGTREELERMQVDDHVAVPVPAEVADLVVLPVIPPEPEELA